MYYKLKQIRCKLEELYLSNGLTNEVLEVSKQLDEEVNKIQKIILMKKSLHKKISHATEKYQIRNSMLYFNNKTIKL